MIKLAVGYAEGMIDAKERAIDYYEKVEGRKAFKYVESQYGYDENGNQVWVTTIWFELLEPTPAEKEKEAEKYLFIGSDDIDPNDPNWREQWEAAQDALKEQTEILENAETEWFLNTDDFDTPRDVIQNNEEHPLQGP